MHIWYMHACMLVNTAMQMNCTVCYAAYQLECRLGRQTFASQPNLQSMMGRYMHMLTSALVSIIPSNTVSAKGKVASGSQQPQQF